MEGERKKRKVKNNKEEDEDEEEKEKMKMFFALIKNTKAMRERIRSGASKEEDEEQKAKGVWNPKFQPEDFVEDDDKKPSTSAVASQPVALSTAQEDMENKEEDKDKVVEGRGGNNELDLNLSL